MVRRKGHSYRFPVNKYNAAYKQTQRDIIDQTLACNKELQTKKKRLKRLQSKVKNVDESLKSPELENRQKNSTGGGTPRRSPKLIHSRQLYPTSLNEEGKMTCPSRTASRRIAETKDSAMEIHGATADNMLPAYEGLFSVLVTAPLPVLNNLFLKSPKLTKKVIPKLVNSHINAFEKSEVNFVRSVQVLYRGGIASKAKYLKIRSSLSMQEKQNESGKEHIKFMYDICMPRLLTYQNLLRQINKIDIGDLYDLRETLCDGLDEEEKVDGKYRDLLQFLLRLAQFYLFVNKQRKDKLVWFGEEEGCFKVAIGGDGAPFGKDDQALSWLVSFLNCGKRISSPEENYLLFGANCSEDCKAARKYICMLRSQIETIEKNTYTVIVNGERKNVSFYFELLPNDMKYLAFIAGELPIQSTYCSPFANVHKNELNELQYKFGDESSFKWHPWKYSERLKVVASVEKEKSKLIKGGKTGKQLRDGVTKYIAKKKSRQEFEPLVGKIIERAKVEPLHVKNNAWQHWHLFVMKYALSLSDVSNCERIEDIPLTSPIGRYYSCIRFTIKATRLAKKIRKWWHDGRTKNKDLEYRFTGKESRLFCHNFMKLLLAIQSAQDDSRRSFKLHVFAYTGINLRNSVSLFNRHKLKDEELQALEIYCGNYFRASSLFLTTKPTSWTIGHVVPVHAKKLHKGLGVGLGVNNMEGREAKHVVLARFAQHSHHRSRWQHVFRHEFVSLIWLRENGHDTTKYKCASNVYIPKHCHEPDICYCGEAKSTEDSKCSFCSHKFQGIIDDCVKGGRITDDAKKYWNGWQIKL